MSKRKVTVSVDNAENIVLTASGDSIVDGAQPTGQERVGETEVDLTVKQAKHSTITVAGVDIARYQDAAVSLEELGNLLDQNLTQQDQIEDLHDLIDNLQAQIEQPLERRNISKIKRLLQSIGTYIGLASLAATQADKARSLFETVKGFLIGG